MRLSTPSASLGMLLQAVSVKPVAKQHKAPNRRAQAGVRVVVFMVPL
jgi:hypothetical protein